MSPPHRSSSFVGPATLSTLFLLLSRGPTHATAAPPSSVNIPGNWQAASGACGSNWDPSCQGTFLDQPYGAGEAGEEVRGDGVWRKKFSVPPGEYEFKVALNGNWNENYGQNGVPGGANIPLVVRAPPSATQSPTPSTSASSSPSETTSALESPSASTSHSPQSAPLVSFFWDEASKYGLHDATNPVISAAGDFQKILGCTENDDPKCMKALLLPSTADPTKLIFTTNNIPGGATYTARPVFSGERFEEDEESNKITFTVPSASSSVAVAFTYDIPSRKFNVVVAGGAGNCEDKPGATGDDCVAPSSLFYDSRNDKFKSPQGAVPANTPLKLRFQTRSNDAEGVTLLYRFHEDDRDTTYRTQEMTRVAPNVPCTPPTTSSDAATPKFTECDLWEAVLTIQNPTVLSYYFSPYDGEFKDKISYGETPAFDNGAGAWYVGPKPEEVFATVVYGGEDEVGRFGDVDGVPKWMKNAVVYHVFPDRFRNGDRSNDIVTGSDFRYAWKGDLDPECRSNRTATTCGEPREQMVFQNLWSALPENHCRAYQPNPCQDPSLNRDFYGGDLRGIIKKLPYIRSLGTTVLYLNPIFAASSNHMYDTRDYMEVAPWFGDEETWEELVRKAERMGIRVVLDGVFNHVSSDSPYFDKFGNWDEVGACESVDSPYRDWFIFIEDEENTGKAPCAGPRGPNTMFYHSFLGYDTLPTLVKSNPEVRDLLFTPSAYWLQNGAAGWRLDAMASGTYTPDFWPSFRSVVRSAKADTFIVGEAMGRHECLPLLYGNRADAVTNYRFRYALQAFLIPLGNKYGEEDPTKFVDIMESIREDYTDLTYYTLWNILDSHDSPRMLWELTPGRENREEREFDATNRQVGKQLFKLAFTIQFTVPGSPLVYYGNEVGVTGSNDPDDRRTFPWRDLNTPSATSNDDDEDEAETEFLQQSAEDPSASTTRKHDYGQGGDPSLLATLRTLSTLRHRNPVFADSLPPTFLLASKKDKTLSYLLRTSQSASLVFINRHPTSEQTLEVQIPRGLLPRRTRWREVFNTAKSEDGTVNGAKAFTVEDGIVKVTLPPLSGSILLEVGGKSFELPDAPSKLSAQTKTSGIGAGSVILSWPRTGFRRTTYNVYRSRVSGGGYELVGAVDGRSARISVERVAGGEEGLEDGAVGEDGRVEAGANERSTKVVYFVDRGVEKGRKYFYVVTAVTSMGVEGKRSGEAEVQL
ncbi:hypothetical protein HK102_000764 [Quaeritorhiza haematococci]|nr:hypothetical protein HK102_000764 [Quaeritorhiza haematococci]